MFIIKCVILVTMLQNPDFLKVGVGDKVTLYKTNKNGLLSAEENQILTMIKYYNIVDKEFGESYL